MSIIARLSKALRAQQWRTAVYEFLLIFLAVLGGLYADEYRETIGQRQRLTEYVDGFIKELEADSAQLARDSIRLNAKSEQTQYVIRHVDDTDLRTRARVAMYIRDQFLDSYIQELPQRTLSAVAQRGDLALLSKSSLLDSVAIFYNYSLQGQRRQLEAHNITLTVLRGSVGDVFDGVILHEIRNRWPTIDTLEIESLLKQRSQILSDAVRRNHFLVHLQFLHGVQKMSKSILNRQLHACIQLRRRLIAYRATL